MVSTASLAGCAPAHMLTQPASPMCRTVASEDGRQVRWMSPLDADDRKHLRAWCDAVGPVVLRNPEGQAASGDRPLAIVSWNMAVGRGDLPALMRDVRASQPDADLIFLLQEAYRTDVVPDDCPPGSGRAKAIAQPRPPGSEDIVAVATRLGLHLAYAPSMRNGTDCAREPREDRGNAILSTLPISNVAVIELPFAQQRRVALAATVGGGRRAIHVMSIHFDTIFGHQRMGEGIWQAAQILGWTDRFVIAGDFNTTLPGDGGRARMRERFKELDCGKGGTHELGRRLDRAFVASGDPALACATERDRFGSDHHPLVALVPVSGPF